MVRVTIRYLANFRELAGTDAETASFPPSSTRDALLRHLRDRGIGLDGSAAVLIIEGTAWNPASGGADEPLEDGSQIYVCAPLSGG